MRTALLHLAITLLPALAVLAQEPPVFSPGAQAMPGAFRLNQDGWIIGAPPSLTSGSPLNALDVIRARHGENSPQYLEACLDQIPGLTEVKKIDEAQKVYDEHAPKAEALLQKAGEAAETEDNLIRLRSQLYRCLEHLLFSRGLFAEFVKTAAMHLTLLRKAKPLEARHAELTTIAALTRQLGELKRVAESRAWVKRAAEIATQHPPGQSPLYLTALISLSRDAQALGLKEESRLFGEKALQVAEKMPSTTPEERLASRLSLARIHMEQGRLLEAETLLAQTRAEFEKADPPDARSLAVILNNIGLVHQRIYDFQGDKDRLLQAEKCFEESYQLAKKSGGDTLDAERGYCSRLANLAVIKARKGKVAESTDLMKQALEAAEKRLGREDQQTIETLARHALAVEAAGRINEAADLMRDLLKRCQSRFGDIHPHTGEAQHLLGRVLMKLGQYNEAEGCYERSAGIRERIHGADHAETAKAYFNLGLIREAKGDFAGATAYYGHVLKIDTQAHGEDSSIVAHDTAALARTLTQEGKFDEAVSRLGQHISFVEKQFGRENLVLSISLLALASIEEKRENYKTAENLFKRVIAIRVQNLGPEHHDVAGARAHYGLFLVSRNKLTLAAAEVRRAAVLFARHNQREGASAADMRACIDIYGNILQRLQYDRQTIQKHLQNLESGIDPEEGKGKSDV